MLRSIGNGTLSRGRWKPVAFICIFVLLALGTNGASASSQTLSFDLRCERSTCMQRVSVGFVHVDTGAEIARTTVAPGAAVEVPSEVFEALEDEELAPSGVLVTTLDKGIVASRLTLDAVIHHNEKLALWPAADVTATIAIVGEPTGSEPLRAKVELLLWSADGSGGFPPAFRAICPVEAGLLMCQVPTGTWDLRLDLPQFAPLERWAVTFVNGDEHDLGTMEIQRGANLFGVLEVRASEIPDLTEAATIRITPARALNVPILEERPRQIRVLQRRVHPQRDGIFTVTGVSVEQHLVQAFVTGVGESELQRMTVRAPVELQMPPLVVSELLRAVLQTGLPFHHEGTQLRVDMSPMQIKSEGERATYSLFVDQSGITELPPVPAGDYLLMISQDDGDVLYGDVVRIDADHPVINVYLQQVEVSGVVTLGDDPLATARLTFSGIHGENVEATTDGGGQFSLTLPTVGDWYVGIEAEEPVVRRNRLKVEVVPGSPVTIDLELTGISGIVRDQTRLPVPSTMLLLIGGGSQIHQLYSDDEGHFEIFAIPTGEYAVQALSLGGDSDLEFLEVKSDEVVELDLRLDPSHSVVQGRLVTLEGVPVASAVGLVLARNTDGDPASLDSESFTSDREGRFAVRLPSNAATYHLIARAEGYDLLIAGDRPVSMDPHHEDTFALSPPSGGTLELVSSASSVGQMRLFLLKDETGFPMSMIRDGANPVARSSGDDEDIMVRTAINMPSGQYRVRGVKLFVRGKRNLSPVGRPDRDHPAVDLGRRSGHPTEGHVEDQPLFRNIIAAKLDSTTTSMTMSR